jgi:hypothetical protein
MTTAARAKRAAERTLHAELVAAQAELDSLCEAQTAITEILELVNNSRAEPRAARSATRRSRSFAKQSWDHEVGTQRIFEMRIRFAPIRW